MSRLVLRSSKLDAKSLAQLTAMHWPLMSYLNVSGNDFDSPAMTQLAKGAWPQLYELVLSNNQIDTAAMAELVHGNWPLLSTLDLSANPLSEPAALGMLKEAKCSKYKVCYCLECSLALLVFKACFRFTGYCGRWI